LLTSAVRERGRTLLLVTHERDTAQTADKWLELRGGVVTSVRRMNSSEDLCPYRLEPQPAEERNMLSGARATTKKIRANVGREPLAFPSHRPPRCQGRSHTRQRKLAMPIH